MAGAVAVDDPGSASVRSVGSRVVVEATGTSPASLRRTLDDLIACLAAAERTAGLVSPPRR